MSRSGGRVLQGGQSIDVAGIWYCYLSGFRFRSVESEEWGQTERMARPALS